MNRLLIYQYINKIKKEDIRKYSLTQNINLTDNELDIIYDYIKNKASIVINNPEKIFDEIRDKISIPVYNKIMELYNKYKDFIN